MKILETADTHYRVRLPTGHEMVIARTPGTQALVLSHQALADGGVVDGGDDENIDWNSPAGLEKARKNLIAFEQEHGITKQPGIEDADPSLPAVSSAPPAAPPPPEAGGPPAAGPQAPAPGYPSFMDLARASAPRARAMEAGPVPTNLPGTPFNPETGATAGATPPEPAPAGGEAPGMPEDLKAAFNPGTTGLPQQYGGMMDMSAYDKAVAKASEDQAAAQDQLATQYASQKPTQPPAPKPVDPGQLYAHVGAMFGAKDPRAQRIIGGIATGLMAGIGEIGAALSHRENMAAKVIQDAVTENIAAQQGANALSREQWIDQMNYATQLANNKIAEIGAHAKAQEIRDNVPIMQATNRAAMYAKLMQMGMMKPEQAVPLGRIEEARAAALRIGSLYRQIPEGAGATIEQYLSKYGHITSPKVTEAYAQTAAANAAFVTAMHAQSPRPPTPREEAMFDDLLLRPGDPYATTEAKLRVWAEKLRQTQATAEMSARGYDPSGAATLTPGARPQ